ncbi:MAG: DUF1501 domain-containing protein [Flavimaricola sp.]|nr:DUF1501 domain-containing protein [Flavimaricola sp.]
MQRRAFLTGLGAIGCSAAASPLLTPMAFASGPWDNRLVVLILRGAMDGLDVVAPLEDQTFLDLRPGLSTQSHLAATSQFGLHPSLSALLPLWQAGEFGAVHAVSTPYRDKRSHFDGQDILEAGLPDLYGDLVGQRGRDGWLNRMIQTLPGLTSEIAYSIGADQMEVLNGSAPFARWAPEARLQLSPATEQLLAVVQHQDPLFREATAEALEIAAATSSDGAAAQVPAHIRAAAFAAQRLSAQSRIASFSLGGWDTHFRQKQTINRALERLAETILTLKDGLGPVWQQTAVLCLTEFGRTARENGTGGTDHGTGGAMLYAGGALRGGQVAGDWPGLHDLYADRDLMPTRDIRAHAGWVMRGLFGLDASVIEQAVFPGLELGAASRILL